MMSKKLSRSFFWKFKVISTFLNRNQSWFITPYMKKNISNKFREIINNLCIKMSFFFLNKKTNKFIRAHKDRLPNFKRSKKKLVYRTNFNDCDVSYVGANG